MIALNVGSNQQVITRPGWVNIDLITYPGVVTMDVRNGMGYRPNSVDLIYASQFIEHLNNVESLVFLGECKRILKCDGLIRLATPDARMLIDDYVKGDMEKYSDGQPALYGRLTSPGNRLSMILFGALAEEPTYTGHKSIYDAAGLEELYRQAGFTRVLPSRAHESADDEMALAAIDPWEQYSLFMEAMP